MKSNIYDCVFEVLLDSVYVFKEWTIWETEIVKDIVDFFAYLLAYTFYIEVREWRANLLEHFIHGILDINKVDLTR